LQQVGQLPQHPSVQQSASQQSVWQHAGQLSQHLSPQQAAAFGAGAMPKLPRVVIPRTIAFRNMVFIRHLKRSRADSGHAKER
jgi:hypothetical protein